MGFLAIPLLRFLIKASSIMKSEAQAVQARREEFLQIAAISDLVSQSTDPTVFSIGLQSLAGLHSCYTGSFSPKLQSSWRRLRTCMLRAALEASHSRTTVSAARDRLLCASVHPLTTSRVLMSLATETLSKSLTKFRITCLVLSTTQQFHPGNMDETFADLLNDPIEVQVAYNFQYLFLLRQAFRPFETSLRKVNTTPHLYFHEWLICA